jgi:general secretion pathway protein A
MYESFYGFREKPFNALPDPDFLYLSKKHEMALTYLDYGLSSQSGFMVLTGEVGAGKTTLLNYLLRNLASDSSHVALIFQTNIQPLELLEAMLSEWGLPYDGKGRIQMYELLNNYLLECYRQQQPVVLILDEAQNLPFETLEEVRMISNLNDEKVPLVHIILSGQPDLKDKLNSPRLTQLRQRITVHYHLEPLDSNETTIYIQHRLKSAGSEDLNIFNPEAVQTIFENSNGIPRVVNLICDLALVYGFAEQKRKIGKDIVELVLQDRRKMGLGVGMEEMLTQSFEGSDERLERIDLRLQELNSNVYEIALIIRKLIKNGDTLNRNQEEIKFLRDSIKALEGKA